MTYRPAIGITPPAKLVSDVRNLVKTGGLLRTSRELGISREAVERLCGGLGVRAGTIVLAERGVAKLRALVKELATRPEVEGT